MGESGRECQEWQRAVDARADPRSRQRSVVFLPMHSEVLLELVTCCPKHAAADARLDWPRKPALEAEARREFLGVSIKTTCEIYGHPRERRRRWVVAAESQAEDAQGRLSAAKI